MLSLKVKKCKKQRDVWRNKAYIDEKKKIMISFPDIFYPFEMFLQILLASKNIFPKIVAGRHVTSEISVNVLRKNDNGLWL